MKSKIFKLALCVFLSLSVALLSGCERMRDMGMTGEMVASPDTDTTTTLKVGVLQPTGHYEGFSKGAVLAQTEINQSGGILGMQVELIVRDNRPATGPFPDPTTSAFTVQTALELVEQENVVALLGPVYSTNAIQVAPVIQVPTLVGATGTNVSEAGEFAFLVGGSNALHGELTAQFAVDELGAKTAAMIHQAGDVYSIGLIEAFDANFQQLGGQIVAAEIYKGGDTTFNEQLAAVQEANPDVLFLASFAPEVPLLMKEAREMGITATFIGGDGMDDPENMLGTLKDNSPLEGTYYTTNLYKTSDDPDAPQFIDAYTALFGSAPDGVAASGYDALHLLKIAIETSQSTDPVAVRDALAGITNYSGATLISHFNESRHPVKSAGILAIRNGQPEPYSVISPYIIDAAE